MAPKPISADDLDLEKLIKALKMTTVAEDNVKLVAIRAANAMLDKVGLDWEFLKTKVTIVNDPFAGSAMPTPPAAKAAPPPPPPPQRLNRSRADVDTRLQQLQAAIHALNPSDVNRLQQVLIDWQHHAPNMFDADHAWLLNVSANFRPRPRDKAEVQRHFDILELANLAIIEVQRLRHVLAEWNRRRDGMMIDADFWWLENLANRHRPKGARGGKAKRLI